MGKALPSGSRRAPGRYARPAQDLTDVDTGGRQRLVRRLGVIGAEPDDDRSAGDIGCRRLEGHRDLVMIWAQFDPPTAARHEVVPDDCETQNARVGAVGSVLIVDRDADGANAGDDGGGHAIPP